MYYSNIIKTRYETLTHNGTTKASRLVQYFPRKNSRNSRKNDRSCEEPTNHYDHHTSKKEDGR